MRGELLDAFTIVLGFAMGFWNGWAWREIMARRRLRQIRQEQDHRDHHVFPHPNGGTFPYMQPVCTCDQFDGDGCDG